MKMNIRLVSLSTVFSIIFTAIVMVQVYSNETNRPVFIVPIGDSITQGGLREDEYSWRYYLFKILVEKGVNIDFVGAYTKGCNPTFTWPDFENKQFDSDHQSIYGIKTAEMRNLIKNDRRKWQHAPDIALIHLGTNDWVSKDYSADIVEPLRDIIDMLREENSEVVILIGHLNIEGGAAAGIRPLVEVMVREESTKKSPVLTVHHYKGFNVNPDLKNADTYDGGHPNPKGQLKMAEKWFEAMKPFLPEIAADGSN